MLIAKETSLFPRKRSEIEAGKILHRYLVNYLSLPVTRVQLPPSQALRFQSQAGELKARETGDEYARDNGKEKERQNAILKTLCARCLSPLPFLHCAPTTFAARERRLGTRQRVRRSVRKSQYDRNFLHNNLSHASLHFSAPSRFSYSIPSDRQFSSNFDFSV